MKQTLISIKSFRLIIKNQLDFVRPNNKIQSHEK